jgi:hypothetical protein
MVTDETKEILGFETRKVIYTNDDRPPYSGSPMPWELFSLSKDHWPGKFLWNSKMRFPNGGMPLEIRTIASRRQTSIVVTQVSQESIPEADVEVPEGYKAMKIRGGLTIPERP